MSDALHASSASPLPTRRPWPLALAVLLAFAAGLAVAWWGLTRWPARTPRSEIVAPIAAHPVAAAKPVAPVSAAPPSAPAADPALLAARTDLLTARIADIEQRTAAVTADAETASGQAGRAEAMLIAAAARRAIDRGTGLGGLQEPLRERFGAAQPRAVQAVLAAIRAPVTLDSLRDGLDALGGTLISGSGDWWPRFRGQLAMLVVIHRAGTPSPLPAERLAHARRLLAAGAIEPALAEVSRLPGAAAATDWIAAARRYVEAQRALDVLDAAAIRGEAAPAPVPSPALNG